MARESRPRKRLHEKALCFLWMKKREKKSRKDRQFSSALIHRRQTPTRTETRTQIDTQPASFKSPKSGLSSRPRTVSVVLATFSYFLHILLLLLFRNPLESSCLATRYRKKKKTYPKWMYAIQPYASAYSMQ